MTWMGLTAIVQPRFHCVFHEIVQVDQDPRPDAPIELQRQLWPGYMLGEMVFKRAGVAVRGGTDHIVRAVAESSTLYSAYERANRPTHDRSRGWGSNSQWRTELRRDYVISDRVYYAVDAKVDRQGPVDDTLTEDEMRELLTHRCFIRAATRHDDRYPYDRQLEAPLVPTSR